MKDFVLLCFILIVFILQVGDVGERPPGPWVADAA